MKLCLKEKFEKNKFWLIFSLASTYLWGLAAHAYCFFDNNISHDSLAEFCGHLTDFNGILGNGLKYATGRFLTPIYKELFRTDIAPPWLAGLLGLLWVGLTVFLVLRIFRIESKSLAFLVAGVMVTNITVSTLAATFFHDFDNEMFSLLLATAAVYFWKCHSRGVLLGAVLLAASMGLYQCFLFTAITFIMMVCIFALLDGERFQKVIVMGLRAIAMILLGGLLYYVLMKAALYLSHASLLTGTVNSLGNALKLTPKTFWDFSVAAYQNWYGYLWYAHSPYSGLLVKKITWILAGIIAVALTWGLANKRVHIWEKLLCLVLVFLLPYGMNLIYVLTQGAMHEVMVYSIWMSYLFALLLGNWLASEWKCINFCKQYIAKAGTVINILCMMLVFVLLYGNVQFSNGMYLKKDIEYDAYLSLMSRVVDRMEEEVAYVPGETQVVFVGLPEDLNDQIPGFEMHSLATGMWSTDILFEYTRQRFQAYFDYVLCAPIKLLEDSQWNAMLENQEVLGMPNYPAKGCIKMVDDVLVVKLGDF